MTVIFSDGFESEDDNFNTNWTGKDVGGGADNVVITSPVHHGTKAEKAYNLLDEGDEASCYKILVSTYSEMYYRFYVRWEDLHQQSTHWNIAMLRNQTSLSGFIPVLNYDGANRKWGLRHNEAGEGGWHNHLETGTSIVSADTWYCIEIYVLVHASAGILRLWVDGTLKREVTGHKTDTQGNINGIASGNVYVEATEVSAITVYYDCVIAADTYNGPEVSGATIGTPTAVIMDNLLMCQRKPEVFRPFSSRFPKLLPRLII